MTVKDAMSMNIELLWSLKMMNCLSDQSVSGNDSGGDAKSPLAGKVHSVSCHERRGDAGNA